MAALSLYELNEHLRRVVALNFPEPVWVRCELAQVSHWRGHRFLTLIEKDTESEEIIAHSEGVFWERDYLQAFQRVGRLLETLLKEGMEVQLKVQPVFHERYGLQLQVLEVDPAYTLGQWELRRRQILETLEKEGLLELNRQLPLPMVLQRIAVVSSPQAAGWQDFRRHLEENEFGYGFRLRFFQVAMQGALVREELSQALEKIAAQSSQFDAVVIIRGGGARLDLAAFDDLELCRRVARFPLPVFTGIGHELDETALDKVANRALKTPTAVADFLLQHNLHFESVLLQTAQGVRHEARVLLNRAALQLQGLRSEVHRMTSLLLQQGHHTLDHLTPTLKHAARQTLLLHSRQLDHLENATRLLDPAQQLQRGYTLTTLDGKILRSAREVQPGRQVRTHLRDGSFLSTIEKIDHETEAPDDL